MKIPFDYYTTGQTPIDCARWISFIRLFAYVRTPACIYSKIQTPSAKKIYRDVYAVSVPEYISNILAECINEISAREASLELEKLPVPDESMLRDLYIEQGVIPFRDHNSTFKPRDVGPYGLSKSTVVRLGATVVEMCAEAVWCNVGLMKQLMVATVSQLGRDAWGVEPAPLWPDEESWLLRSGGTWKQGVIYDEVHSDT